MSCLHRNPRSDRGASLWLSQVFLSTCSESKGLRFSRRKKSNFSLCKKRFFFCVHELEGTVVRWPRISCLINSKAECWALDSDKQYEMLDTDQGHSACPLEPPPSSTSSSTACSGVFCFEYDCAIQQGAEQSHAKMQTAAHADSWPDPSSSCWCPNSSPAAVKWLCVMNVQGPGQTEQGILHPKDTTKPPKVAEIPTSWPTLQHPHMDIQLPLYFSYKTIAKTQNLKKKNNTQTQYVFIPSFVAENK